MRRVLLLAIVLTAMLGASARPAAADHVPSAPGCGNEVVGIIERIGGREEGLLLAGLRGPLRPPPCAHLLSGA